MVDEKEEKDEEYFNKTLEDAQNLIEENKYGLAIITFKKLLPLAEEYSWSDRVEMLKDLISKTEKMNQEFKAMMEEEDSARGARDSKAGTYKRANAIMDDASHKVDEGDLQGARAKYEECIVLFKNINATREVEIIRDTILKINDDIKEKTRRKTSRKVQAQKREQEAKKREQELVAEKLVREKKFKEEAEKAKQLKEKKASEKELYEKATSILDSANQKLRGVKGKTYLSEESLNKDFDEIITLFNDAIGVFKAQGWLDEMGHVKTSISLVEGERKKKLNLLAAELKKRAPAKPISTQRVATKYKKEATESRIMKLKEREEEKARRVKESELALDVAKAKLDKYEEKGNIIGGKFKENEYPEIIALYQKVLDIYLENNWQSEARVISNSIAAIKEREKAFLAEKKTFEARLERKRQLEEEEDRKIELIKKVRDKREKETELKVRQEMERERRLKEITRSNVNSILDRAMRYYKGQDYEKSEEEYKNAIELMKELGWDAEVERIKTTLNVIKEKKALKQQRMVEQEKAMAERRSYEQRLKNLSQEVARKQSEEETQAERELRKQQEERAMRKNLEEELFVHLSGAKTAMDNKVFNLAIEEYGNALDIAKKLHWTSQIKDIGDFIMAAKEKQLKLEALEARKREQVQKQEKIAEEIRAAPDVDVPKAPPKRTDIKSEVDRKASEEAYELLDKAKASLRDGMKVDAVFYYQKALEKFLSLEWNREAEFVFNDMKKVEKQIEMEEKAEGKESDDQKSKVAYGALDRAEVLKSLQDYEKAIPLYEQAATIFKDIGWEKEGEMVARQIESVKKEMDNKQLVIQRGQEKVKSEKAFQLLDMAKRQERERHITKALEFGQQALDIFESLGQEWARETERIREFVKRLEKEKARKDELIRKLQSGEL